jgi:hypothetical protein
VLSSWCNQSAGSAGTPSATRRPAIFHRVGHGHRAWSTKMGDEISRPSAGTQNSEAWLAVADENAVDVEIKTHRPPISLQVPLRTVHHAQA